MRSIFKKLSAATALSLLLSIGQSAAFTDAEKEELGKFVKEFLLENPEILLEAQDVLEERQKIAQQEEMQNAIEGMSDQLFSAKDDIIVGNEDATITIVEFFDYNCGYCKRALSDMQQIVSKDSDVKFVLKEFPILGQESADAARVSIAVSRIAPEKAGEFHSKLLAFNGRVGQEAAFSIVEELDIDISSIKNEMDADDLMDGVRTNLELADALGVNGTPSYVIGNEAIYGAVGAQELSLRIANMRACGHTTCE